jgi:hypothetical protein
LVVPARVSPGSAKIPPLLPELGLLKSSADPVPEGLNIIRYDVEGKPFMLEFKVIQTPHLSVIETEVDLFIYRQVEFFSLEVRPNARTRSGGRGDTWWWAVDDAPAGSLKRWSLHCGGERGE